MSIGNRPGQKLGKAEKECLGIYPMSHVCESDDAKECIKECEVCTHKDETPSGKDCSTCNKCIIYLPCLDMADLKKLATKKEDANPKALKKLQKEYDDDAQKDISLARQEIEEDTQDYVNVTEKNKGSCFPAGAVMRGDDGKPIQMSDLAVGAQVHAAGSVDRVTNFIHHDRDQEETFLRLITEKGTLELSPNHLVFLKAADGSRKSVFAEAVSTGDMLFHRDGHAQVAAIEPFKSRGVYAPLTRSGEVEVNGFHTSCYASFPSHEAAHAVMLPLHYLPANTGGVHWYARGWQRMYEGAQWVMSKF